MYEYAATRADFVDVYGDPSGRKTNSDTWTSFGVGSEICNPDGTLNIRGGYITVDVLHRYVPVREVLHHEGFR